MSANANIEQILSETKEGLGSGREGLYLLPQFLVLWLPAQVVHCTCRFMLVMFVMLVHY